MMTRMLLPLSIADISSFAKKLKTSLEKRAAEGQSPPSHLELCNLLAGVTGMRKALLQFDAAGSLVRLPNKRPAQPRAMLWMWTQFAVRRELVNMKLLGRKSDCSEYWKEPVRPSENVQDFLRALRQAVAGAQPTRALTALNAHYKHKEMTHATT